MACYTRERLKACPSSLPQATAESQAAVGGLRYSPETLDPSVVEELRQFLRIVLDKWERRRRGEKSESAIAYIEGLWGYGKSFYARLLVERLAPEMGVHAVYEVFDNIRSFVNKLIEEGISNPEALSEEIARRLLRGGPEGRPVVAVLDEIESLVTAHWSGSSEEKLLVDAFILLYQSLANPDIEHLGWARGRLHLVLVLTPAASMRLERILEEAMKSGKLLRRYDSLITLGPAPKYIAKRIAESYLQGTLGISLADLVGSEEYFNSLYLSTGGSPGTLILLLNMLARVSSQDCPHDERDCCVCTLHPRTLADALSRLELVSPEGEKYRPGSELLRTLTARIRGELLSKVLALAPLTPEEAAELRRLAGLRSETITVYGPLSAEQVASWVDAVTSAFCGGRENCRVIVRRGIQYMIHVAGGDEYYVTLPSPDRIVDWLLYFGYEEQPPQGALEKIASGLGTGQTMLMLPPGEAAKLYSSPGEAGLDYILDKRARDYVRTQIKYLITRPAKLACKASEGLRRALRILSLYGEGLPWLEWEAGEPRYRLEINNVKYSIPLRFECTTDSEPGDEPVIIVRIGGPSSGTGVKDRIVTLGLSEGDLRFLAALSLVGEEYGENALEPSRVSERTRNLVRATGLAGLLERAAQWMRTHGYIVEPLKHEASFGKLVSQLRDRYNAMKDIARVLAALGGGYKYVPRSLIVDVLWSMISVTPYSRSGKRWCGVQLPSIGSYSDLKDVESREELERIIDSSLNALVTEGLVDVSAGGEEDAYKLVPDNITERIPGEMLAAKERDVESIAARFFILPSDETNKRDALYRLLLRKAILDYLSKGGDTRREIGNILNRIMKIDKTLGEAQTKINNLAAIIRRAVGDAPDELFRSLVVCKEKSCKIISYEGIVNLRKTLERTAKAFEREPSAAVNETLRLLNSMERLAWGMADLLTVAANDAATEIDIKYNDIRIIDNYLKILEESLSIISGSGLSELAEQAKKAVISMISQAESNINKYIERAVRYAIKMLEAAKAGKLARHPDKEKVHFSHCDGKSRSERMEVRRYYPLWLGLYEYRNYVNSRPLEEYERKLRNLVEAAQDLANILLEIDESLVKSIRHRIEKDLATPTSEEQIDKIIRIMKKHSEYIKMDQEKIKERELALERIRGNINKSEDNYKKSIDTINKLLNILNELESVTGESLELDEIRERANRILDELNDLYLEIANLRDTCLEAPAQDYKWCEEKAEDLYQRTREKLSEASTLYRDGERLRERTVQSLLESAEKLRSVLQTYRDVLLRELQEGDERLDPAVRGITALIQEIQEVTGKHARDLGGLAKGLARVESEWARLKSQYREHIARAARLLEILDDLRSGEMTLEELLERLPVEGGADTATVLRRLVEAARRAGFEVVVGLRREEA